MAGSKEIANRANLTEKQVKAVFEAVNTLTEIIGEKVTIQGFGSFKTVVRNARAGRNPQTGDKMTIPAKTALTFKQSSPKKPKKA